MTTSLSNWQKKRRRKRGKKFGQERKKSFSCSGVDFQACSGTESVLVLASLALAHRRHVYACSGVTFSLCFTFSHVLVLMLFNFFFFVTNAWS